MSGKLIWESGNFVENSVNNVDMCCKKASLTKISYEVWKVWQNDQRNWNYEFRVWI